MHRLATCAVRAPQVPSGLNCQISRLTARSGLLPQTTDGARPVRNGHYSARVSAYISCFSLIFSHQSVSVANTSVCAVQHNSVSECARVF